MKAKSSRSSSLTVKQQLKQIKKEINVLKAQLPKRHLTKSAEQDYDVESQIIDKQNQMIELFIKLSKKNLK